MANILAENLPAEYTKNLPTKELEGTKDTKKPSTNEKAKKEAYLIGNQFPTKTHF